MSELYNRIETLCKNKGTNVTEMCRQSGAPRGSLSDLKAGKTNRLNTTTLSKIALYFGVSVDYLLGNEEIEKSPSEADELSDTQKKAFEYIKNATPEQLESFIKLLEIAKGLDL